MSWFYKPADDAQCVNVWPDAGLFKLTFWRFAVVGKTDAKSLDVWAYRYIRLLGPIWWKDEWLGTHSNLLPSGCFVIMLLVGLATLLGVAGGVYFGWQIGVAIGSGLVAIVLAGILFGFVRAIFELLRR